MTTTTIGPAPSWRLIHDGASVMMLAPMEGVTSTPYSVFEAATASDCVAYAKALRLTVPEELEGLFAAPIEQLDAMPLPSLAPTEAPAYDPITHGVRAATPVKVGNDWHQAWEVFPLPAEEVAANQAAAIQAAREQAKAQRQAAVDAIKVTTQGGHTFDGDETSQTRMARAVLAMQATGAPSVTWVLADNTVIQATVPELTEALALAGAEQARLWVIE